MKKLLIILILFTAQSLAFSQFKKEIDSLHKKGGYYLGKFKLFDEKKGGGQIKLSKDIDIQNIEKFYMVIEIPFLDAYCSWAGSSLNYLWVERAIKYKFKDSTTFALMEIFWSSDQDRIKLYKLEHNIMLGYFAIRISKKDIDPLYMSFTLIQEPHCDKLLEPDTILLSDTVHVKSVYAEKKSFQVSDKACCLPCRKTICKVYVQNLTTDTLWIAQEEGMPRIMPIAPNGVNLIGFEYLQSPTFKKRNSIVTYSFDSPEKESREYREIVFEMSLKAD